MDENKSQISAAVKRTENSEGVSKAVDEKEKKDVTKEEKQVGAKKSKIRRRSSTPLVSLDREIII